MSSLQLVALIVHDYDPAISFFVNKLGFELVEDKPSFTTDGRPKRWVVVRPPGSLPQTGILLARADSPEQSATVGRQFAGRVGLFWRVDDFQGTYNRLCSHGIQFISEPRAEEYGNVAVFLDFVGNKWDLLGPSGEN
ncbi:uncharacterized protein ATNIH1004_002165 [Aspergillus tanneri]|uniref:VOC domain-containing protein n=1 Tax=Aspergillus tanneri TaxID=1220188 RepID=A0A5M9MVT4_9EURO|nr:uncharacterized protein ATNIH1004_002165 [Aspergillus tanneri]KAA8649494.1 hypothetical protein ATNIH1004_002165 [Aspergillus tanneri]